MKRSTGDEMPSAISIEDVPGFIPRMVMTPQLQTVMSHVIRQWKHRDRFSPLAQYGIRPLDRLLFYGPPGNGKTMACEWMAKQLGMRLLRVHCDQVTGSLLGETTKKVAAIVEWLGDRKEPSLCLFDEIESIFIDRRSGGADSSCGHELSAATTIFMQALDRWTAPTLIVMCTNLRGKIDFALQSRVELQLEFAGPTPEQAIECLAFWREILSGYGADEWGPVMEAQIRTAAPESFRALRHAIAIAAREWVANGL